MKLDAAIIKYLNHCKAEGLAASTCRLYGDDLASLRAYLGAEIELDRVREDDVVAWLAWLREKPNQVRGGLLAPATIQHHYRSANAFFGWCVRKAYLEANPLAGVRQPRTPARAVRALTLDEMGRLLDALGDSLQAPRNVAIGYLLLDTGLRLAELCALRAQDVDLRERLVTVRAGKGGKGRVAPVASATAAALRVWLAVRPPAAPGATLFGATPGAVYQMLRRAGRRAGLRVYPHLLRHTMATHYDGPVDDLQKILGHSDPATTARLYRHRGIREIRDRHAERSALAQLHKVLAGRDAGDGSQ